MNHLVGAIVAGIGVLGFTVFGVFLGGATAQSEDPCGTVPIVGEAPSTLTDAVGAGNEGVAMQHVQVIVHTATRHELPGRAAVIAVATAIQESRLQNLTYGDRDSLGLFQQRPSQGWGTPAQINDPALSTAAFFGVAEHTTNPGLVDITDWQLMSLAAASHEVQRSAFPDATAQWEVLAKQLVVAAGGAAESLGAVGQPCGEWTGAVVGEGAGAEAAKKALSALGTPYSWGGGGPHGPSLGFGRGAKTVGFDCSSLMQFAWFQATEGQVRIPRTSLEQWRAAVPVAAEQLQPGDMLFFEGHVAMFIGGGAMVHAPRTGKNVEVVEQVVTAAGGVSHPYWGAKFRGFGRPAVSE